MDIDFQMSQQIWREQGQYEAKINDDLRHQHGRGPNSIFILDTSASLGPDGFDQMKQTFTTMIDEYERHCEIDENIAVIVCGHFTRFQRHFSNRYEDIRQCIDDVEFGGPSPLTAAFFLAEGSMINRASHGKRGDFHTRIICITDGRPTDFTAEMSCDDSSLIETEADKDHLLQLTRMIGRVCPIFCIPVGKNPDTMCLEFICAQSRGGKVVYPEHAKQFAKYSQNMKTASELSLSLLNDGNDRERILICLAGTFPNRDFTEMDQDDIVEIYTKKHLYRPGDAFIEEVDIDNERDPTMPPVGSRVKRGRDWRWGEQDSFCAGTVVNHSPPGWLAVKWDSGSRFNYRYGSSPDFEEKYDLEVCDEPRTLKEEIIAVGSLVKRGTDWKWANQDGGPGNIGSVFKVQRNGYVNVRWQNGNENIYRFGRSGKYDLEICDPFSPEATTFLKDQMESAAIDNPIGNKSEEFYADSPHKKECGDVFTVNQNSKPLLRVTKGKFFKNKVTEHSQFTDLEIDGHPFPLAVNQWFWKDGEGKWNPYSREINERINKCFKRNPRSTVVVTIQNQTYRIVMAKHIQINLTTREISDVKFMKDDSLHI
ncbi:uncharacterized protein LOC111131169 isoform X1 [Crassostrea virginica]